MLFSCSNNSNQIINTDTNNTETISDSESQQTETASDDLGEYDFNQRKFTIVYSADQMARHGPIMLKK